MSPARRVRGTHCPQPRKLTASRVERGASTLTNKPFLLTPTRGTQGAKSSPHGTREPTGSCRQTWECYAERSPLRRTGRPDTRAQAWLPQLPDTALRHRHASHRTRKTRHDTAHDRRANTSTSTAPPSRGSTLRLPWGTQGCTEGDRRGLATDGGGHMISTSEAERTAEGHREIPGDELCV